MWFRICKTTVWEGFPGSDAGFGMDERLNPESRDYPQRSARPYRLTVMTEDGLKTLERELLEQATNTRKPPSMKHQASTW
ncbi:hypothetical protein Pla100_02620 [Neorhodopirellula pilleata]|uniref:Uncharacterized protein n=1 Tax=Neorhodopirellula pilleata TaxID=2714738 RepID=A0A5C6ATH2_9BACT|nr:hypothetical protein Pla100_02620 [Neorhodopirellula pilleata]